VARARREDLVTRCWTLSEAVGCPRRDTALCLLAEAQLLAGDVDLAAGSFAEASGVSTELGHADVLVVSESELALLLMDRGRWDEAAPHVESAITAVD
jgi:LuxR family maltose regulon positive regulatory protein